MDFLKGIELLKATVIPDTEIINVTYEDKGIFEDCGGNVHRDLPKFYRVVLLSEPGSGSHIYTEVWLPEDWNGIFLGLGNGGMAGSISYWGLTGHIRQGYAAANTDLGTSRGRNSGINNPDVWKDFGWRATHIMTESAKALILSLYGRKAEYSYFIGGSTGGQQALAEAQRFPVDYDGIIAGVPANNRTLLHTYFLWNHVHLRPKNKGALFSVSEIQAVTDSAVKYFQTMGDGIEGDNFISFPKAEENIINGFADFLSREHPEFSNVQLNALKAVYTGPVNPSDGERIYNGMPIGSEIYGCGIDECQQEESPHFYPFIWTFGENYDGYDFDFDKDLELLNNKLAEDLNANSPDLSEFMQNGGKLIMYSGSADPCVPYPDAMNYYDRVTKQMGGYEKTQSFFRYFLLPGKDHGWSGNGTNAILSGSSDSGELEALRLWREEGKAPDSLTAVGYNNKKQEDGIRFSRRVYPHSEDSQKQCPPVCSEYYLNK